MDGGTKNRNIFFSVLLLLLCQLGCSAEKPPAKKLDEFSEKDMLEFNQLRGDNFDFIEKGPVEFLHELKLSGDLTYIVWYRPNDWIKAKHIPDLIVSEVSEVDPYLALECVASGIKISPTAYEQAIARLQQYVEAADIDGRIAAARLLGDLGHEDAVAILMDAMSHGTWEVRQAAAWALRDVRISPLPGLLEALHDWDQDDSDVTATAVRQIGSNAIPMLLSILHGEHWSMRRGAAWAAGTRPCP